MTSTTDLHTVKDDIVAVVLRAGIGIRAELIADRVALPDGVALETVLGELLSEGRLISRYTLLTNGEPTRLYNVPVSD